MSEIVRNITRLGRIIRIIGGIILIIGGLIMTFMPLFCDHEWLNRLFVFGFFTGGVLALLESRNQVCVLHAFWGTRESSRGSKQHEVKDIAVACRMKGFNIIVQTMVVGSAMTILVEFI